MYIVIKKRLVGPLLTDNSLFLFSEFSRHKLIVFKATYKIESMLGNSCL